MLFKIDDSPKMTDCTRGPANHKELCSVGLDGQPDNKHTIYASADVINPGRSAASQPGDYYEVSFVPVVKKVTFEKPAITREVPYSEFQLARSIAGG